MKFYPGFSLFPQTWTFENYRVIFTDPTWYWVILQLDYLRIAEHRYFSFRWRLPAAFAFSRYSFLGRQTTVLLVC